MTAGSEYVKIRKRNFQRDVVRKCKEEYGSIVGKNKFLYRAEQISPFSVFSVPQVLRS